MKLNPQPSLSKDSCKVSDVNVATNVMIQKEPITPSTAETSFAVKGVFFMMPNV